MVACFRPLQVVVRPPPCNNAEEGALHLLRLRHCLTGIVLVVMACSPPDRGEGRLVVTDDAGDTVTMAGPARRVVSLVPATTEILFAIGAGSQVVGRTHWCDYPDAALQVADVGDGLSPNLEAVLGQEPDLVVLYFSGANSAATARLRALGIPALQLSVDRLSDVSRIARLLGRLTGHGPEADSLAAAYHAGLDRASVPAPADPVSVLIAAWDQPPMVIGGGSFLSEMVERAGGRNLFNDLTAPSAQVSIETIVARDPDVVLVSSDGPPAMASRPEWRTVPAVRSGRFVRVTSSAYSRPSPRAPEAIADLVPRLEAARQ